MKITLDCEGGSIATITVIGDQRGDVSVVFVTRADKRSDEVQAHASLTRRTARTLAAALHEAAR